MLSTLTNFWPSCTERSGLPVANGLMAAGQRGGLPAPRSLEASTPCYQDGPPTLRERVFAAFKAVYGKLASLGPSLVGRISAIFSTIFTRWNKAPLPVGHGTPPRADRGQAPTAAVGTVEASAGLDSTFSAVVEQLRSTHEERQGTESPPSLDLGQLDGAAFYALQHQRCLGFLAGDREKPLLERFGIACPNQDVPRREQLQAMISRTRCILESMEEVLKDFPTLDAPKYTAEALVLRLPPATLCLVLDIAYRCNLYKMFGPLAGVAAGLSLDEAIQLIRHWLDGEEARNTTALTAAKACITCIPSELGVLKKLQKLNLAHNQIKVLPPELGRLRNLIGLNLLSNHIEVVPPEIERLTKLEELWLAQNRLETLPPGLGGLTKLKELWLDQNHLLTLPPELGQLTELQQLGLHGNGLKLLPAEVGRLSNLLGLDLGLNQLEILPPELCQLSKLQTLQLGRNQLAVMPPDVGRLEGLIELRVARNRLKELPAELGQLGALRVLKLSGNQLPAPPSAVGRLANLEVLWLSDNSGLKLPDELDCLPKLRVLYVDEGQRKTLPSALTGVAQLAT